MSKIRILHTADWHLGKRLADTDRTEDFRQFLDWLLDLIEAQSIDVLLIAGDVFDTTMPATDAQRLYYEFLSRAAKSRLLKTIVTAGNHDSQRFLSAPKALLGVMNCVIAGETPEEEAIIVHDREGRPMLGVAAVPYLREGDVRTAGEGTTEVERVEGWEAGVANRYRAVRALLGERLRAEAGDSLANLPLVAMGHLFVAGSSVSPMRSTETSTEGEETQTAQNRTFNETAALSTTTTVDGALSHYVGTLRNVGAAVFNGDWDYVALGHIHCAQRVKHFNNDTGFAQARYSGAPLALSFRSERYAHQLVLIEIDADAPKQTAKRASVTIIPVPQPRFIGRIKGNFDELERAILEVGSRAPSGLAPILEAEFTLEGAEARALIAPLRACAEKAGVVLGPIRAAVSAQLDAADESLTRLEDITPEEVFDDVLKRRRSSNEANKEAADDQSATRLRACFAEAVAAARNTLGVRRESARGAGAVAELARICAETHGAPEA